MTDVLTEEQRSLCMSSIRSKNTKPELLLRKALWANNIRGYRIKNSLPGKPDLYFPKKKVAVFIDGCFWHKCPKCYVAPKSNKKYWLPKIERNAERDKKITKKLKREGFIVIRLWDHEIKENIKKCVIRIATYL